MAELRVDLEAIRKRADAAYPPPWFWNSYSGVFSGCCRQTGECVSTPEGFNGCPVLEDHDEECTPNIAWVPASYGDTATGVNAANAEFIAHAREDVPALLAAIDKQESEIRALRELLVVQGKHE